MLHFSIPLYSHPDQACSVGPIGQAGRGGASGFGSLLVLVAVITRQIDTL